SGRARDSQRVQFGRRVLGGQAQSRHAAHRALQFSRLNQPQLLCQRRKAEGRAPAHALVASARADAFPRRLRSARIRQQVLGPPGRRGLRRHHHLGRVRSDHVVAFAPSARLGRDCGGRRDSVVRAVGFEIMMLAWHREDPLMTWRKLLILVATAALYVAGANAAPSAALVGFPPAWFPKAPSLTQAEGDIIRVTNADELLAAVERVAPGGTILLADGEYKLPRVIVLRQKKDLAIRSASGDPAKVTLRGKGWASKAQGDDLIHIGACDGVTIADLNFTDCHSYGIKVEAENAPKNIHIYNCRFRDIGVRAIKGSAGQDPNSRAVKGSVRYCVFEN